MEDQTIKCKECDNSFVWPAKEQEFFKAQGFFPPKRCKTCIHTGFKKEDGLTADERKEKFEAE